MKKQKSKTKSQKIADVARGTKRSQRLKKSRAKVAGIKKDIAARRLNAKLKYEEFMKKMMDARMKGEF